MDSDLEIIWPKANKHIQLSMSNKRLTKGGQHGKSVLLQDTTNGETWVLKVFGNIFNAESNTIDMTDVDLSAKPGLMRDRLHLWRVVNEHVAARLAERLELNVPNALIVCSERAQSPLNEATELKLGSDEIILNSETGRPETAQEFYNILAREEYGIRSSTKFDNFLASKSGSGDPTHALAIITKFVPDSMNLEEFLEEKELEKGQEELKALDDGYKLLPFDTWLNDPDRNQGNYLVTTDEMGNALSIYGLDYEMWSFGRDSWMDQDEVTKGRSYLTAVVHSGTHALDSRILETLFRIGDITDDELRLLTLSPTIIPKFIEYNINAGLKTDERMKLLNIEENIWDFLYETRPRLSRLHRRIVRQVGLPKNLKELERRIVDENTQES